MLALIAIADAPSRFNALKREIEGISPKMLTQTLRRLERNGLASRTVKPTVPVRVTYAITPLGRSLATMMDEVRVWSIANIGDALTDSPAMINVRQSRPHHNRYRTRFPNLLRLRRWLRRAVPSAQAAKGGVTSAWFVRLGQAGSPAAILEAVQPPCTEEDGATLILISQS